MLNDHMEAEASVEVTYYTGSGSVVVNAVPTKPPFVSNATGPALDPAKAERNFSILADDLVISAVRFTPETTHYITQSIDGTTYRYNVAKPQSGMGCWEWETGYMHGSPLAKIIVHTKYHGTV